MLLDTRTACYILMVLCRDLAIGNKSRSRATLHFRRYLYPPNTNTSDFLRAVSHCLDYRCKIKGGLVTAYTRALRRLPDGNLVYQITRSAFIPVILMACAIAMNVTEICEPTSITDQRKLWAAFVAGYTSMHQRPVVNARPSRDIFISPSLFWGCGYHSSHATSVAKVLHCTALSML